MGDQVEESLSRLGTRVNWVEDYAEIPDRLATIYKSAGGDWEADRFLEALARKAGVSPSVYAEPSTKLYVFRAQVIPSTTVP